MDELEPLLFDAQTAVVPINANAIIKWYKDILQVNKTNTSGTLQVREISVPD